MTDFGYVRDYKSSTSSDKEKKNFGHFFSILDYDLDLKKARLKDIEECIDKNKSSWIFYKIDIIDINPFFKYI